MTFILLAYQHPEISKETRYVLYAVTRQMVWL